MPKKSGPKPEHISFDEAKHIGMAALLGETSIERMIGSIRPLVESYAGKKLADKEVEYVDISAIRFAREFRERYGLAFGMYNIFYGNEVQGDRLCLKPKCQEILAVIRFRIVAVTDLEGELCKIGSIAPPELYEMLIATNRDIALCLKHRDWARENIDRNKKELKAGGLVALPTPISLFEGHKPANDR